MGLPGRRGTAGAEGRRVAYLLLACLRKTLNEMDSTTSGIKDKFLAGAAVLVLLACYMLLTFWHADTKFIEGAFLVMLGTLAGLLKQTPTTQGQTVTGDVVEKKDVH